eukprot:8599041-Heterocapsa_arctica.AAC.1
MVPPPVLLRLPPRLVRFLLVPEALLVPRGGPLLGWRPRALRIFSALLLPEPFPVPFSPSPSVQGPSCGPARPLALAWPAWHPGLRHFSS